MTLAEAQTELAMWQTALEKILSGAQSYQIAGRTLTRADLAEVKRGRDEAQRRVDALQSGRGRGVRVLPVIVRDI